MRHRQEWRPGVDFAEFAEALGINTDQIMAATKLDGEHATVLFTAEPDEHGFDPDEPIYAASLARDADGILVVTSRQLTSMTWGPLRQAIEERMDEVARKEGWVDDDA